MNKLPINLILPDLKNTLRSSNNAVLVAPPGAGKTTRVPLALLDEAWLAGRRILMLEPRRLAARAAARYMAAVLEEQVGETVGYRVRLDTKVGSNTRIEVVTEGVLTRMLQADPALEAVGVVIFDEYHERNLHADVGLALCLQSQAILRPDLRIVVMSATLAAEPVAALLDDAPVLVSQGKAFPVETRYLQQHSADNIEALVVWTIQDALASSNGNILVFLPGAGEIRRVETQLTAAGLGNHVLIAPLFGNLPQQVQDAAIAPSLPGQRKVVLATAIAETSITVEGVSVVIDSGLMRVPRFSPRTGMTRLETVRVSRAAADQRRGRAGRLSPGVCYRLWSERDDLSLEAHSTPEMLAADLAPLALELAAWGIADPLELRWLNPPPLAVFSQACDLLRRLGALDHSGVITGYGRRLAETGLHPRLAHIILKALPLGLGKLACELAVLLGGRDLFKQAGGNYDADLRLRVEALRLAPADIEARAADVNMGVYRNCRAELNQLQQQLGIRTDGANDIENCGLLLAFAYPDRIAQQRNAGRFLLSNGRGAALAQAQLLANVPYLVAAELDDQGVDSHVFLAAPVTLDELKLYCREQINTEACIVWDGAAQAVRARQYERLGALIIQDIPLLAPAAEKILAALLHGVAEEGLAILPWTKNARQLQQRLVFMHHIESGWPDMSDAALAAALDNWLAPYVYGMQSRTDLQRLNLVEILASSLTWEQRRELDEYAPTHITVPSGQRTAVNYSDPAAPVLAVRLQELFGLAETPCIARGRVPLMLQLLSPAHRPVQVTRDLASFWRNAYFEVKKDLMGRYPKHYWPDDPLSAIPTNRTRPRV